MLRLFTTWYPEARPARQVEYADCLRRNLACAELDQVCLTFEGEGLPLPASAKLRVRKILKRPLYDDYFSWINELAGPDDVSIIANTDIWFDSSIAVLAQALRQGECFALARWDGDELFDRNDSQDCWVFRGKINGVRGDFPTGVARCDARLLYELQAAGYRVRNPAFSVKAHHLHSGQRVEYPAENLPHFVQPPYRYLWPHNLFGFWRTRWFNLTHSGQRIGYRLDKRAIRRTLPVRAFNKINNARRRLAKRVISFSLNVLRSYPRKVQCNLCGWAGRHFDSDSWHEQVCCPRCHSDVRHRLLLAALQHLERLSFREVIDGKAILHFAPEEVLVGLLRKRAARFVTADFLRRDCDLTLDMSDMPEIATQDFGCVIALDVLEHVPDYKKALREVHRILTPNGYGLFSVPQKDHLAVTYENPAIVTPEERTKHFGQSDHLRIFGDDFRALVESQGFTVVAVEPSMFSDSLRTMHVLSPPVLSQHPLATNYRKIFFCRKAAV